MSTILERIADEPSKNGDKGQYHDSQLEEQCPDLHAWLSTDEFRDQPRRLPSISIFVDERDGRLKCSLNDKQTDQTAFWTFKTAFGCWRELQEALAGDNLDWQPSTWSKRQKNRR